MKTCAFNEMAESLGIRQDVVNALKNKYTDNYGVLFIKAFGIVNGRVHCASEEEQCFAQAALERHYIYQCSQTELGLRDLQKDIFGTDVFDAEYYCYDDREYAYSYNGERYEVSDHEHYLEKVFDSKKFRQVAPYSKSQINAIAEYLKNCSPKYYVTINAYYSLGLPELSTATCPKTRTAQKVWVDRFSHALYRYNRDKFELLLLSRGELDERTLNIQCELEWLKKDETVRHFLEMKKLIGVRKAVQDAYSPTTRYVLSSLPIEDCGFSVRLFNALKRAGLNTVGDILSYKESELLRIRNMGRHTMQELQDYLRENLQEE